SVAELIDRLAHARSRVRRNTDHPTNDVGHRRLGNTGGRGDVQDGRVSCGRRGHAFATAALAAAIARESTAAASFTPASAGTNGSSCSMAMVCALPFAISAAT